MTVKKCPSCDGKGSVANKDTYGVVSGWVCWRCAGEGVVEEGYDMEGYDPEEDEMDDADKELVDALLYVYSEEQEEEKWCCELARTGPVERREDGTYSFDMCGLSEPITFCPYCGSRL